MIHFGPKGSGAFRKYGLVGESVIVPLPLGVTFFQTTADDYMYDGSLPGNPVTNVISFTNLWSHVNLLMLPYN